MALLVTRPPLSHPELMAGHHEANAETLYNCPFPSAVWCPAVLQSNWLPVFFVVWEAFSSSRCEGKPALSFLAFPAPGSAAGTGQPGGGEESKLGPQPAGRKERSWLHSLADRVLSEKEKRVCQPPAWTIRARTVPGFNLFYPLAACGGLSRPAATKGKSTELLPLKYSFPVMCLQTVLAVIDTSITQNSRFSCVEC